MTVVVPRRPTGRPAARQATGLRERAWWLIRTLRKPFTLDDLLFTLNDGGFKDAHGNLLVYLKRLEITGVVGRLKRRAIGASPQSRGAVLWRLRQDLGPVPPVWRSKNGALWDPNSQVLIPPIEAEAEAAAGDGK
jgi:hypothetical protein